MKPDNDEILAIVLAERAEGHPEAGSVAADSVTAQTYHELSAVVRMAESARPKESKWREDAISKTIAQINSSQSAAFRAQTRPATIWKPALAAAAAACVAFIAALAFQPSPTAKAPVQVAEQPIVRVDPEAAKLSLAAQIDSAAAGSTLEIPATDSAETMRVSKPIKMLAVGGTVRIGVRQ